jgi:hypothetical protein
MFAKINTQNELIQYPTDPWEDHPEALQLDYEGGVIGNDIYVKVKLTSDPRLETLKFNEKMIEKNPEFINDEWVQVWEVIQLTDEELKSKQEHLIQIIKQNRNKILDKTDWTQMPDNQLSDEKKQIWSEFRESVRNILDQNIPLEDIRFPALPKFASKKQPEFQDLLEI